MRNYWLHLSASAALSLTALAGGCRSRERGEATATPAVRQPTWDSLPEVTAVRIAHATVRIQAHANVALLAPQTGRLRITVPAEKHSLSAGEIWAEYDTGAEEEAKRIGETRKRLNRLLEYKRAIELPRERLKLVRALEGVQTRQAAMRLLQEEGPRWSQLGLPPSAQLSAENGASLADEVRLCKEALAWIDRDPESALGWNEGSMLIELDKRDAECRRELERSVLRMPFSGRLDVELKESGAGGFCMVQINDELAIATQDDRIELTVEPTPAAWLLIAGESFHARVKLPTGGEISGSFAGTRERLLFGRNVLESRFAIPEKDAAVARPLLGAETSCDLWLDLPKRARVVPKLTVALAAPVACREFGWGGAAAILWPGARIVVEGESDLAISRGEP